MSASILPAIHPGEILLEEFLQPLGMTPYALAQVLNVPRTRIERVVREENPVTTDTALRLARFFGTTPEFWLSLQASYDIKTEAVAKRDELEKIRPREIAA